MFNKQKLKSVSTLIFSFDKALLTRENPETKFQKTWLLRIQFSQNSKTRQYNMDNKWTSGL
jgi:hypothetical protein